MSEEKEYIDCPACGERMVRREGVDGELFDPQDEEGEIYVESCTFECFSCWTNVVIPITMSDKFY